MAEEDLTHDFNDIIVAPQMQVHIGRKMSQIIEKQIEFITIPSSTTKTKKIKSKVKLLRDSECFVKPYEEFEDTYAGPGTRPNIKRRNIDNDEVDELRQLSEAAIEIQDINKEVCNWAKKPERKDRFFEYTQGSTGQIHAKPMVNEFTALRRKNKWSEHKIKEAIST